MTTEICPEAQPLNHLETAKSENYLQQQNSTKGGWYECQGAPEKENQ